MTCQPPPLSLRLSQSLRQSLSHRQGLLVCQCNKLFPVFVYVFFLVREFLPYVVIDSSFVEIEALIAWLKVETLLEIGKEIRGVVIDLWFFPRSVAPQ